jgi:hypothetical protein
MQFLFVDGDSAGKPGTQFMRVALNAHRQLGTDSLAARLLLTLLRTLLRRLLRTHEEENYRLVHAGGS